MLPCLLVPALILAGALTAPAAHAAAFEGKVQFKLTSARDREAPTELNYSLKGTKIRADFPALGGGGAMIIDLDKQQSLMLMPEQKMYMVMPMGPGALGPTAEREGPESKLEKTGNTETILGYRATKYVSAEAEGTTTELWLAEGLGSFVAMSRSANPIAGGRGREAQKSWEKALAGKELFPLRVITRSRNGQETFRMEATKVEKSSLPASLFEAPADYEKLDLGGMMQGRLPGFGR